MDKGCRMKKFREYNKSCITKEQLIDYLGGSCMGEEGQPDSIEMLLALLNPIDVNSNVEGQRKCILEWNYDGDDYFEYLKYNNKM